MQIGRRVLVLAVGCSAACSGSRSEQSPPQAATEHQPPPAVVAAVQDTTPGDPISPGAIHAYAAGIPKFAAGKYELVLVRDEPVFDDSLAVRDRVEQAFAWRALDSARYWPDSVRLIDAYFNAMAGTPDIMYDWRKATTTKDSEEVARSILEDVRCTEWRSGGTLTLESDGRFAEEDEMRTYCHGKVPAYTRRMQRSKEPRRLETCKSWEAPVAGMVPHLTCRSGRWWDGLIGYKYVGDTLTLNGDCDGRDTYVLRVPEQVRTLARSSDVSKVDDC
jgi:hypothetical protein